MTSPFPGMDPFLEGYHWPDVHHRLATTIAEILAPKIAPKYVARIELYTVQDIHPEEEIGIMYPDVEILRKQNKLEEPAVSYGKGNDTLTPTTISIPAIRSIPVRIPVVEIRDRGKNQLITAIEILSPVNKRPPGLQPYREKRDRLHAAGVHLLEIDLLRRGERPFAHPNVPRTHYLVSLVRGNGHNTDIWAFNVQDPMPVVPVPLNLPDPDVHLDLGEALKIIYQRGLYHLSVDYAEAPPPPAFGEKEQSWMEQLIEVEKKKDPAAEE